MQSVGIGIVGAGFVADVHARNLARQRNDGVRIVGITSRSRPKAEALAHAHGIEQVVSDFDALLALPDVDIIDLCVPNQLHHPFALQAIAAEKHVIVEKPLTGYFGTGESAVGNTARKTMLEHALASAEEMLDAATRAGVKLMYAENWLYSPVVQKAKRLVEVSGGTIFDMRGEESHHGSHSVAAKQWQTSGGGSLIRLGSHPIAAVLHLKWWEGMWRNDQPIVPVRVLADVANPDRIVSHQQQPQTWVVQDWHDVESWSHTIITFSDGAKATITATDICIGGMKDTLDLYLSNARLHCNFSRANLLEAYAPDAAVFQDEYLVEKLETKAGWSTPSIDEDWFLGYPQELRDFVEAVRHDRAPLSTGELGRDVVKVIYSAYLSAEEGRQVQIQT